jgi:hypothetical protein
MIFLVLACRPLLQPMASGGGGGGQVISWRWKPLLPSQVPPKGGGGGGGSSTEFLKFDAPQTKAPAPQRPRDAPQAEPIFFYLSRKKRWGKKKKEFKNEYFVQMWNIESNFPAISKL